MQPGGAAIPANLMRARTSIRAFAFIDVFVVTMGFVPGPAEFGKREPLI